MILTQNKLLKSNSLGISGQIPLPHFHLVPQIGKPTLQRMDQLTNQSERVDQAPHLAVGQQGQQQGNRQRSGWC